MSRFNLRRLSFAALSLAALLPAPAHASDHADPMSINVFKVQEDPVANLTDLHAFVADSNGRAIGDTRKPRLDDFLVVSICMRRALMPADAQALDLNGYSFRIHLDLDPSLRFFDPTKTRDGRDYAQAIAAADPAERGRLVSAHDADASMQALYGAIFTDPRGIAEETTLTFQLGLEKSGDTYNAVLTGQQIDGLAVPVHLITDDLSPSAPPASLRPGALNLSAGIYDDPFIFPRFFRRNVVAVIAAIPLSSLRSPSTGAPLLDRPILLWATTHKAGKQIDHVGRSLRTQLPRFGYLNDKPPSRHLEAIMQVHDRPDLMENITATVISPLIAHRHYDSAPDVMVYDLGQPALFPNGRRYEDDVAKTLADAGETLLFELSYAESKQVPRATTNDKPFRPGFPYLAPRWTPAEIAQFATPGSTRVVDGQTVLVPRAADMDATRRPNLTNGVWRSIWLGLTLAFVALGVLLFIALRSLTARLIFLALTIGGLIYLLPVRLPDDGTPAQPANKLTQVVVSALLLKTLFLAWIFTLGRRSVRCRHIAPCDPAALQGLTPADRQPERNSFDALKATAFSQPYSDRPWGSPDSKAFPVYPVTFRTLASRWWSNSPFVAASRRTLISRADLRWGPDRQGQPRLLFPNGVVLSGTWSIDTTTPFRNYTGLFAPGATARVLARYSASTGETRSCHPRSLALAAKLFPDATTPARPAHFVVQEDVGGTVTQTIRDAVLTNSPPITVSFGGIGLSLMSIVGLVQARVDAHMAERQLYELAELNKAPDQPTSCPRYLRLVLVSDKSPTAGENVDFREELLGCIYDRGDARPRRVLEFAVEISDTGERRGLFHQRIVGQNWTRIGRLRFDEAAVTKIGDHVLHFHHPAWRRDRNDPTTLARPDLASQ